MENTSYIALSRETALLRQMDVVANNMANVNTPAYKAQQMMFTQYLVKTPSDNTPFGRKLAFTQDVGVLRNTSEGPLTQTGDQLDIALHGAGYFVVDSPSGPHYTRAGHFQLDSNGMVVTPSGAPLLTKTNQPIVVAPNETQISIAGDGTVSTENGQIGQIQVVSFPNDQNLRASGDGTYDTTDTPTPVTTPSMVQGMLESSNVEPVSQMTDMLSILRNYEGIMNLIQLEHDRQLKAVDSLSEAQQA
jgi:flagellar basal-body rod protein FlgF